MTTFECEYCEELFESRELIREHKKSCSKKLPEFECSFCNELFSSKQNLNTHILKCVKKQNYKCYGYGCEEKFPTQSKLNYHQNNCTAALQKCHWITKSNNRCTFTGKYEGYCKKHYVDYKYYDPDGVLDDEGDTDICSVEIISTYIPSSIDRMTRGDFYSLDYLFNKSLYSIQKHNTTNVIMKNEETEESVIFWENKETRKQKEGKLITQLSAEYSYECENQPVIVFNDDVKMCKRCFERSYNTKIGSLIVKKK